MAKSKDISIGKVFCATGLDGISEEIQKELSGKKKNLTIDLKKVERVDTLALQLLVSTQSSCKAKGGELKLTNMPVPVSDAINILGLSILSDE